MEEFPARRFMIEVLVKEEDKQAVIKLAGIMYLFNGSGVFVSLRFGDQQ